MTSLDAATSRSARLPNLLMLDTDRDLWKPEELQAILRTLASPLEFDLCVLGPESAAILAGSAAPADAPLRTFRDLFQHPHPPLELLEATRQFAKTCRSNPEGPAHRRASRRKAGARPPKVPACQGEGGRPGEGGREALRARQGCEARQADQEARSPPAKGKRAAKGRRG